MPVRMSAAITNDKLTLPTMIPNNGIILPIDYSSLITPYGLLIPTKRPYQQLEWLKTGKRGDLNSEDLYIGLLRGDGFLYYGNNYSSKPKEALIKIPIGNGLILPELSENSDFLGASAALCAGYIKGEKPRDPHALIRDMKNLVNFKHWTTIDISMIKGRDFLPLLSEGESTEPEVYKNREESLNDIFREWLLRAKDNDECRMENHGYRLENRRTAYHTLTDWCRDGLE